MVHTRIHPKTYTWKLLSIRLMLISRKIHVCLFDKIHVFVRQNSCVCSTEIHVCLLDKNSWVCSTKIHECIRQNSYVCSTKFICVFDKINVRLFDRNSCVCSTKIHVCVRQKFMCLFDRNFAVELNRFCCSRKILISLMIFFVSLLQLLFDTEIREKAETDSTNQNQLVIFWGNQF
jgi:hypothetical protein